MYFAFDPVADALDLISRLPADPADFGGQHLDALESTVEVLARQTMDNAQRRGALAERLGIVTDDDQAALDELVALTVRVERHRRADELVSEYIQNSPLAQNELITQALGVANRPRSPKDPT
ncbi:MAG: hypothetical protein QOK49_1815 [Baekduia sp.]|jgi:hypothetical protein|nr:hypothetical protein [Baekduia sp.]